MEPADPLDTDPRSARIRAWSAAHPYGDTLTDDQIAAGFVEVFGREPTAADRMPGGLWDEWSEFAHMNHCPDDHPEDN